MVKVCSQRDWGSLFDLGSEWRKAASQNCHIEITLANRNTCSLGPVMRNVPASLFFKISKVDMGDLP